jgi:hypothetical protein
MVARTEPHEGLHLGDKVASVCGVTEEELSMSKKVKAAIATLALLAAISSSARAEPWTAEVCNGGACTGGDPVIVGAFMAARVVQKNIERNFKASRQESSVLNKAIRSTTGISIRNIKKYGLAGGRNSEVRKAGRAIAKVFGW